MIYIKFTNYIVNFITIQPEPTTSKNQDIEGNNKPPGLKNFPYQYNTKDLFRNEGHRPIIQNSHNTVLARSGKLIVYMWFILLNNMYKDISLNVQLFQREIVIEPNICLGISKSVSQRLFL